MNQKRKCSYGDMATAIICLLQTNQHQVSLQFKAITWTTQIQNPAILLRSGRYFLSFFFFFLNLSAIYWQEVGKMRKKINNSVCFIFYNYEKNEQGQFINLNILCKNKIANNMSISMLFFINILVDPDNILCLC